MRHARAITPGRHVCVSAERKDPDHLIGGQQLALPGELGVGRVLRLGSRQLPLLLRDVVGKISFQARSVPWHGHVDHVLAILGVREKLHGGERRLKNLVAAPVVPVPVRIDDVQHRFAGELAHLGKNGLAAGGCTAGVEHDHAFAGEDGDRVSPEANVAVARGGEQIHAIGDLGHGHFAVVGGGAEQSKG